MRYNFPASKPRSIETFYKELERVGIERHPKRRTINKLNRTVVDIYYSVFKAGMKKLYKSLEVNTWESVVNTEEFLLKLKAYNGDHIKNMEFLE